MNFPLSWTNGLLRRQTTPETYSKIKELGLESVVWEEFPVQTNKEELISRCESFVANYAPCLFIFDPRTEEVKKGFLFGVENIEEIRTWLENNDTNNYKFLVTSQVTNPGNGFVGSVFSDGKGELYCETMHRPGVCNQQELSKAKKEIAQYLDHFVCEGGGIYSSELTHLTSEDMHEITNTYLFYKGYFEFVKGLHLNRQRIVTTGFEKLDFPINEHLDMILNQEKRRKAVSFCQVQRP